MTYQETIDYLYSRLPMFSRIGGAAYKNNLDNTIALCNFLDNPHDKFPSIHIAGTNGKGSTSHMLASILQENGYKTGLYTSPHLKDFRERIRINGEKISESFVIEFTKRTKEITENIQPSFFELTVAMAFDYFSQNKVDVAIIETGMGGRLDSTNVITPLLSIITNISYDHMAFLGNTLDAIASEKGGIIKQNIPVVIGESHPETSNLFKEKAIEKKSPIVFADLMYTAKTTKSDLFFQECEVKDVTTGQTENFKLDLTGNYQISNLKTVLAAEKILIDLGFKIDISREKVALQQVKKNTGLRGRWDIQSEDPLIIADVAHNKAGIQEILNQLSKSYDFSKVHFILGFVKDKDVSSVLELFPKNAHYYFTNAAIERALPSTELKKMAEDVGLSGADYDNINKAVENAKSNLKDGDLVMICGSFFIIAELSAF
jgi:dihydrofolate synthase/folylpolyglutamate synthase